MSSINLKNLSMTIFGESHGVLVGGVVTGFPAGLKLNYEKIYEDVLRRKPGNDIYSTARKETDEFEIVSGVLDGVTTGAPLCVIIKNSDSHSTDYSYLKHTPRPSHSDYSAYLKYNGYNDIRGGGHFSGRLTAPMVVLGSIAKQYLEKEDIKVISHIYKVKEYCDKSFINANDEEFLKIISGKRTILDIEDEILDEVKKAKEDGDSLGGCIECAVLNMKKGIGGPLFEGLEGKLSQLIYAIPAVKAVEFGAGVDFLSGTGSSLNDLYEIKDGNVQTTSNNNGGILGGISNGENLVIRATFKPTPSIFKEQKTVNLNSMSEEMLKIKGRHDPIVALRGIPALEGIVAFGILDSIL